MDDQRSLEQQLLGDMTYNDPRKAAAPAPVTDARLAGASAPILDDMDGGAWSAPARPQTQYQELTDEQVGILQQQRAAQGLPPYTAEEIAELKAEFIERQRTAAQQQAMAAQAAAQQQAAAMLLQEPEEYVAKEKKNVEELLPQVNASDLLEEPAPEPERRVTFNQEDLEAAKRQATKRAAASLTEAPAKTEEDQRRARKEMELLRQQQQADLAQAGFPVSIVLTILGVLAGACMAIFASGGYPDPEAVSGFFHFMDKFYLYGGILMALLSITIVLRVQAVKGFTSFMFIISSILLIVPGIVVLLTKKGIPSFGVIAGVYVVAVILCFAVTFTMSTSDKLNAYYGRKEIMYD